jgi:hypothetical protein
VAAYFADYGMHQSHSLGIFRDDVERQGLNVTSLEDDPALQDAVLSVHHAALHTFGGPAVKLIENHLGRTFAKVRQQIAIQVPAQFAVPGPGGLNPPPNT